MLGDFEKHLNHQRTALVAKHEEKGAENSIGVNTYL